MNEPTTPPKAQESNFESLPLVEQWRQLADLGREIGGTWPGNALRGLYKLADDSATYIAALEWVVELLRDAPPAMANPSMAWQDAYSEWWEHRCKALSPSAEDQG